MEHPGAFDPQLSADLHNEIQKIGWDSMQHKLTYEQAAPTWWDQFGEECLASGLAARLAPEIIEFLKLARTIGSELQCMGTGYEHFFYYVRGLLPPTVLLVDNGQFGGRPDQFLRLYMVNDQLKSHPFGVVFDQDTLRVRALYSLTTDDDRRPWMPLQSLLGAYLDMVRIGKITAGEESDDDDEENSGSEEEEDDSEDDEGGSEDDEDDSDDNEDIDLEMQLDFSIEPARPWYFHSHSQKILNRTVKAFANLLKAIQERMPDAATSSDGPPATSDSLKQAIALLLSTSQTGQRTFAIKFLQHVQKHLASAQPRLRFIAPGIRILQAADLTKQPFEGIDFHTSKYNNPILIFAAEDDDGRDASTDLDGTRNPFPRPYDQNRSSYACGLWISESTIDFTEFDDQCRLVLPRSASSVHHARSTDGYLLESNDGPGFRIGLYQSVINPFITWNHGVELFRVLENWVELVESGFWQVDERGVMGGIHKWQEADQDEAKSVRTSPTRVPFSCTYNAAAPQALGLIPLWEPISQHQPIVRPLELIWLRPFQECWDCYILFDRVPSTSVLHTTMSSPLGDYITPILILTGTLIVTFLVARSMFRHDPREPPLAPSSIPLIGHAVGLSRSSFNYYVELSKQITAPIFTVSLPGQKVYVVTKPELIQQVQKQHRTLAFPPIEAKFATVVVGLSKQGQAVLARNLNGEEGGHGLSMETYAAMRAALQPGPALDEMNRAMLAEINKSLHILAPVKEKKEFGLFEWLRDNLTLATTRAVYGPRNPFDEKEIRDAFWDFDAGLMQILIAFLLSIMARRPINARTKVVRAFQKYYSEGGIDEASAYARYRHEVEVKNEFPAEDMARSSVGGTIALLVNTVPSVFWMLLHLHAYPGLLGQVRDEIDACTLDDGTVKTIDMASLKEQCPLLLSTYREVLCHRAMGASVREVMEDTQLDGFHLKKGAMLHMPSRVIHADESLWGSTEFNPRRFLESEKDARPRDVCFRAFGGGKTLCPDRHFATNEILAVVALWIARFDMLPVGGECKEPTTAKTNVAAAVMGPDKDVQVEIATRKGLEHVTWAVKLKASDKTFAIVAEDFEEIESKEVA